MSGDIRYLEVRDFGRGPCVIERIWPVTELAVFLQLEFGLESEELMEGCK